MDIKKVLAVTAAVVGTSAMAIESSVVGYTGDTTGADNNFRVVPFSAVGYNTSDIQQIKIDDDGAGTIGWGSEKFEIWEGLPTAVEGSGFTYWDPSMDPEGTATECFWGDDASNKASLSIAPGQGVVVNCAEDLTVTTAGEVPTQPISFTSIADNNFTGNPFPQTIDIQAISIDDDGAGTIGWGSEKFEIWEGLPTAVEGSGFTYWDPSMDPEGTATECFWGDDASNKATWSIAPGQGVVINCVDGLTITIAPPYSL